MKIIRVHCAVLNARTRHPGSTCSQSYGGHGERETPGLIPNPEAKPLSADGTALETGWESRTPPDNHSPNGGQSHELWPPFALSVHQHSPIERMRRYSMRYPEHDFSATRF